MSITTGTNTAETLSAILAMGALVADASLTIFIMPESAVSSATEVARQFTYPDLFIVAAYTLSPIALSIGILSPLSADSSTAHSPSTISPSAAKLSPGRTTNISPTRSSEVSITTSSPSRIILASFGASSISASIAPVVFPFALASSSFPTVINTSIIAADSK